MSAFPAPSSLNRTQISLIISATLATLGALYYAVDILFEEPIEESIAPTSTSGLQRRGAIRRPARRRASDLNPDEPLPTIENDTDTPGATTEGPARPLPAVEVAVNTAELTVVDEQEFQDNPSWANDSPRDYPRSGQNIVQLLFRVSEDATRRNAYIHRGCACNHCGTVPIRGIRYRCSNCADYDLCETCESLSPHTKTHIFYKVKVPAPSFRPTIMQPVWYSGNPDERQHGLTKELVAKLSQDTGFERPELEAYWEQWTYMANTQWRDDPTSLNLAMDRRTFERCLVPSGGRHNPPGLIFDRMFAFYDTNKDDLIGFTEFLRGLSYRKHKDKWQRIFLAYDIDGDGYVCRKDFLRIFRSYHILYRQMHQDLVEGMGTQQMSHSTTLKVVTGRQPLSSQFGADDGGTFPPALPNPHSGEGKMPFPYEDHEIQDGKGLVRDSGNDTGKREDSMRENTHIGSRQRRASPPAGYWEVLLDLPESFEQLPEAVRNINRDRRWNATAESIAVEARREGMSNPFEDPPSGHSTIWPPSFPTITDEDAKAVEGAGTCVADVPLSLRRLVVKEASKRIIKQQEIHERWKRRQFYTDEEEGATPPNDWDPREDILFNVSAEGSSSANQRPSHHSRSSSKVRFAEDLDDLENRSVYSSSTRSVPERWGGMEIPEAERDAGKEILYQVTQQAFNELLDAIFRDRETMAIKAEETKVERDTYRHIFGTPEFGKKAHEVREQGEARQAIKPKKAAISKDVDPFGQTVPRDQPLADLLEQSGYTVQVTALPAEDDAVRDVSEVAQEVPSDAIAGAIMAEANIPSDGVNASPERATLHAITNLPRRDPTMPQFRPNTLDDFHTQPMFNSMQNLYGSTSNAIAHTGLTSDEEDEDPTLMTPALPRAISSSPEDLTLMTPALPRAISSSPEDLTLMTPAVPLSSSLEDLTLMTSEIPTSQSSAKPADDSEDMVLIDPAFPPSSRPITPPPPYNPNTPLAHPITPTRTPLTSSQDPLFSIQNTYEHIATRNSLLSATTVPSANRLWQLWEIEEAEKESKVRGGFGRINVKEFVACVKAGQKDGKGMQMEYLGSWVDFCIPP